MKQALATGIAITSMAIALIVVLVMLGIAALFPQYILGPFMTIHSQRGYVDASGEIQTETERTIHYRAPSGHYFVRVDRLLPEPATLVCHGDEAVPYTKIGRRMLHIDLGYYVDDKPGKGREICPQAYNAEVIQLRTLWCQYRIFGWCAGPVEPDAPLIIDMRPADR